MANLPIPTLAQVSPGTFDTSSLWNSNVYNGLTYLLGPPVFVGYQSTVMSLPNTTWGSLTLDTTVTDPYGGHSNTVNNTRYTCQIAGWYTCCGSYAAAANSTGFRAARLQVNGNPIPGGATYGPNNGSVESGVHTPTKDLFLNVGDYVEVGAWQASGGGLNTILDVDLRCGLWVRFSHV